MTTYKTGHGDLGIALLMIVFAVAIVLSSWQRPATPKTYTAGQIVYQVCQQSRMSPTIDERGCDDLQDQLHVEYLCKQNNMEASNHCWTEDK